MATKDFGAAEFTTSVNLKNTILNYKSTVHENRFYNFRKKNEKELKNGISNEYFICLDCEREIAGNFKLQFCFVTVSNGRIIKNPDSGHHKNCKGQTFAMVETTKLDREARLGKRKHEKMDTSQFHAACEIIKVKSLLPEYKSMEKCLRRLRRKASDQMSLQEDRSRKSIPKILVGDENRSTSDRKNWLLTCSMDLGVLAFASELDMKLMHASTNLIIDGFYKCFTDGFVQMYTIYAWGYFVYEAIPVCHVAVGCKSMESYIYLFSKIRAKLIELYGGIGSLETVHLDFEIAAHLGLKKVFPELTVKGCNFHFNKTLDAKLRALSLNEILGKNEQIGEWIGSIKALALIPPVTIPIAVKIIRLRTPTSGNEDVTNALKEFSKYFENTWLNGPFPVSVWNHWTNDGPRTSHLAEEYQDHLNSVESQTFLTLDNFVELMQPLHNRDQIRIQKLWTGSSMPSIRGSEQIRLERRISEARKDFCGGTGENWSNLSLLNWRPNFMHDFKRDLLCFISRMRHLVGKETRAVIHVY